ncbi:murein L,D-transpeptidase catalytic domain-containing protein [Chryseobacterium viscerum]|uniref:Peptidase n=1 Tax=Chryseobacterium viscerum TaxID=1037377 RepID=A0A5N4BMC0_9FLAO|nr:murein L,D-transpeptidase catalytic domain family protein [Chryseobacterium viscerum]KAB1229550.1 peptidase [Chryseobacterium viscerum]
MKKIGLLFIVFWICSCSQEKKDNIRNIIEPAIVAEKKPEVELSKLKIKAEEALKFCTSKNLNRDFCILIDMSLHSGIKRFFVWDFKNNKISKEYLVGHGCGPNSWSKDGSKANPGFSNEDGSHLSSLGKYKLEGRGYSDWGINIKYLMHGLEETNSNALKRFIVFHSWNMMSDTEVFPQGSPEGWGCPTVSNNAMKEIDPMIQKSGKPVLMWIYN